MHTYIYEIGTGSGDEIEKVLFSQEMLADSLGEAIDKAKAMTRKRSMNDGEDTVRIIDETELGREVIWARSAEEIRQG